MFPDIIVLKIWLWKNGWEFLISFVIGKKFILSTTIRILLHLSQASERKKLSRHKYFKTNQSVLISRTSRCSLPNRHHYEISPLIRRYFITNFHSKCWPKDITRVRLNFATFAGQTMTSSISDKLQPLKKHCPACGIAYSRARRFMESDF